MSGLGEGSDGRSRCSWGLSAPDYVAYHDEEWGRPVTDDRGIYEKLTLEAFQSGLSWLTILRKRDNFRAAFDGFDFERVAAYGERDVRPADGRRRDRPQPGEDRGGDRERAGHAGAGFAGGESLAAIAWAHRPESEPAPTRMEDVPATTPESKALAKELKRRGFRFVGPTTAYALMQAVGIVNDHLEGCVVRDEVEAERAAVLRAGPRL